MKDQTHDLEPAVESVEFLEKLEAADPLEASSAVIAKIMLSISKQTRSPDA